MPRRGHAFVSFSFPSAIAANRGDSMQRPPPAAVSAPRCKTEMDKTKEAAAVGGVAATAKAEKKRQKRKSTARRPWYKRKRIWIVSVVAFLVPVGLVAGCVMGLRAERAALEKSSSSPTPTPTPSICRNKTCTQMLTAATVNNELHLFALGRDGALWTKMNNGSTDGWSSGEQDWTSLGGQFQGPPASVVWNANSQIDVFGTSGSVLTKSYRNGVWDGNWLSLGGANGSGSGNSGDAIATCHVTWNGLDRPDVWMRNSTDTGTQSGGLLHNSWDKGWLPTWDPSGGGNLASAPGVACRNDPTFHDIVGYSSSDRSVWHTQYNNASGWGAWTSRGGSFAGDPVLVAPSSSRVDFFGTGTDGSVYHFSWTSGAGYSDLANIGGHFESVPSVVVTSSTRLDVVALGTDDLVKHRALVGSTWSPDWEDLGVFSNGAPLAVTFGAQPFQVAVFVVGQDNDVQVATWNVTDDPSWQNISKFERIGGNMTT